MSSRPKRRAAIAAAAAIVISESDDEANEEGEPSKQKRQRIQRETNITKEKKSTDSETTRRRWPTKNKNLLPSAENSPTSAVENESVPDVENEGIDGNVCARNERQSARNSVGGALRGIWKLHELLAETQQIEPHAAKNIVDLFNQENTIPFICRYRRDLINHISPERLRDIKASYNDIVSLRKKSENIVTQLEKDKQINENIRHEILSAKSAEELEFLYAPYKPANKGSLAERAKALGLEVYADRLLYGELPIVDLLAIVQRSNPELDSTEKVLTGLCHIIAHNISKHTGVLEELRRLQKVNRITLQSSKTSSSRKASENKPPNTMQQHKGNANVSSKYELYFKFEADVRYVKPHQVLAINRGEKSKFLSVKIGVPDHLKYSLKQFVFDMYMSEGARYPLRSTVFERSFEECYKKKLQPLTSRQVRAHLNEVAQKASVDVFANNLKQLLLMSPLKGECILGLDPGFTNGCKLAVISESGIVLETGVLYPHTRSANLEECGMRLSKILVRHNCSLIALGNGTACRETEVWLSKMFEQRIIDARYCIVSEQGASVYSCSETAKKEFPNMDPNEISAVSIARRLNDPLSEYVKIQPRHIGVGMYQHDVNEKVLDEMLNDVVSECVSFVGIDVNTASLSLLKHVAGLSEKKAEKILEHRNSGGLFSSRRDLLKVKSIGEKTYTQCAGFIRIEKSSLGKPLKNPLDCTWVHPESYEIAKQIIAKCKLSIKDIGQPNFIDTIKEFVSTTEIERLAQEHKLPKERLEIVLTALQREPLKDYRSDIGKRPLFKQGVTSLADLTEGESVTGAVTNITHFGAFVDVGVECDGLIHTSQMAGAQLTVGDQITASVISVDKARRRLALRMVEIKLENDAVDL